MVTRRGAFVEGNGGIIDLGVNYLARPGNDFPSRSQHRKMLSRLMAKKRGVVVQKLRGLLCISRPRTTMGMVKTKRRKSEKNLF
jgi:hypothetical protein